ncbi:MAG TPA: tlde1 domain-containing protein [Isosphaeraceae bacterium]|nr:tlde1 domain-containing protein [Isosphaeraceae bacterium]
MADLTYDISARRLYGKLDDTSFDIVAVSGGRAGSTTPGAVDPSLANNPFRTRQKESTTKKGGPIPPGLYGMKATHPLNSFKRIVLTPDASNDMSAEGGGTRGGFLIHPRGPIGSQGCIVPMNASDFADLWQAVRDNDGGTLEVKIGVKAINDEAGPAYV